jgi:hypothetical protein
MEHSTPFFYGTTRSPHGSWKYPILVMYVYKRQMYIDNNHLFQHPTTFHISYIIPYNHFKVNKTTLQVTAFLTSTNLTTSSMCVSPCCETELAEIWAGRYRLAVPQFVKPNHLLLVTRGLELIFVSTVYLPTYLTVIDVHNYCHHGRCHFPQVYPNALAGTWAGRHVWLHRSMSNYHGRLFCRLGEWAISYSI